jgi:hypothetical protein
VIPGPEVLQIVGWNTHKKGTNKLSFREIDQIIKTVPSRLSQVTSDPADQMFRWMR